MEWNRHPELANKHTFLSPSKYAFLRKSDEELINSYYGSFATEVGTATHAFAADCIKLQHTLDEDDWRHLEFELLRKRFPKGSFDIGFIFPTVHQYVNDSIARNMDPEIGLMYSNLCGGTADAIAFRRKKLFIHDLKTGTTPAKIDQLMGYAALFFLEYGYKPESTHTELRIYQAGDIFVCEPKPDEVREVMDAIVHADLVVQNLKEE